MSDLLTKRRVRAEMHCGGKKTSGQKERTKTHTKNVDALGIALQENIDSSMSMRVTVTQTLARPRTPFTLPGKLVELSAV